MTNENWGSQLPQSWMHCILCWRNTAFWSWQMHQSPISLPGEQRQRPGSARVQWLTCLFFLDGTHCAGLSSADDQHKSFTSTETFEIYNGAHAFRMIPSVCVAVLVTSITYQVASVWILSLGNISCKSRVIEFAKGTAGGCQGTTCFQIFRFTII